MDRSGRRRDGVLGSAGEPPRSAGLVEVPVGKRCVGGTAVRRAVGFLCHEVGSGSVLFPQAQEAGPAAAVPGVLLEVTGRAVEPGAVGPSGGAVRG